VTDTTFTNSSPEPDTMPPVDISQLTAEQVPSFSVPNHDASEGLDSDENRPNVLNFLRQNRGESGQRGSGTAGKSRREKEKRIPRTPKGGLKKALEELYTTVGMGVMMMDPHCGTVIIENAPKCAEALNNMADQNQALKRILLRIVETSLIGELMFAHAPIVMAVMAHHVPKFRDASMAMATMMQSQTSAETPQTPEDSAS
jgi:hypothetical protein